MIKIGSVSSDKWVPVLARSQKDGIVTGKIHVVIRKVLKMPREGGVSQKSNI